MVGPSRFESDTHRFRWYYTLLSACKSALAKLVLLPSFILNLWNGFTLVARRHGNWLEIADCFLSGFWEAKELRIRKATAPRALMTSDHYLATTYPVEDRASSSTCVPRRIITRTAWLWRAR